MTALLVAGLFLVYPILGLLLSARKFVLHCCSNVNDLFMC